MRGLPNRRGVTLIELVVVIAIVAIIGTALGGFIVPAMKSYEGQSRRAALVDAAESALRRMGRDMRISVPNSLRITNPDSTFFAVEMIPTVDGGRYCSSGVANCSAASELLDITSDTQFDILGCFRNPTFVATLGSATSAYRLVVNNTGDAVYTATGTSAVLTPSTTTLTLTTVTGGGSGSGGCGSSSGVNTSFRHNLLLSAAQTFPAVSPRQRAFIVEDAAVPVTYICNTSLGTLKRYAGYKNGSAYSTASQPTDPSAAPLSSATSQTTVAENVTGCNLGTFTVATSGDVQEKGLALASLKLTSGDESVKLVYQVQLDNSQ